MSVWLNLPLTIDLFAHSFIVIDNENRAFQINAPISIRCIHKITTTIDNQISLFSETNICNLRL